MATGFYAFCLLSSVAQLHWVLKHGTFLVRRGESQGSMNLCHCANEEHGFLVEVRLTCNCQQANF
ncbi:hypothetical protein HHL22_08060 [Hymenobacter sp. RP-2-7]|uniref:Uncharacterized protein n=1 Tax=Hymenobacter polaris TaxID=2682546 RepID=A0A7Y0FLT9_9BACT|nr:hypothetical protein [Hymenobacter polaris]NML65157.1 hypothetical protein [Hymenobacter polaris]